jgi:hypothetical protein
VKGLKAMRITKPMIVAFLGLILTLAGGGPGLLGPQATVGESPRTGTSEAAPESDPGFKGRPQHDEALHAALSAGLKWLATEQKDDGHWSLDGTIQIDGNHVAATALGLLPFLRAGEVPWSQKPRPEHAKYVENGLKHLLRQQRHDGSFDQVLYIHALATMAVSEAYSSKSNLVPAQAVQRAADYIVSGQSAKGGWSYAAKQERSDTSNTGWQIQALRSAERAGARVPKETWAKVSRYLDSVAAPGGRYGYIGPQPGSAAMTASALLARRALGWEPDHPDFVKGIAVLQAQPQAMTQEGCYYTYYAAQVINDLGADTRLWNLQLRRHLLRAQEADGGWSKARDRWGQTCGRLLVTSFSLMALESRAAYVPLPEPPAELTATQIERLWNDLAEGDASRAARAMRLLAALPQQTVPLLHKRLQPVRPADEARIARLIDDLDSDEFAVRDRAAGELEKLGEQAAPAMEKVLETKVSLEVRKRVERLLARLDEQDMPSDRLQAIRAIKVLEYLGTAEAQRLLKRLAAGAPGALPTEEAKASLQRLAKRPAAKP